MDVKVLEVIAGQTLLKHGLKGWSFGLANTKRRLGVCKFHTKQIEISEYYAVNSSAESVMDTLLHEVAHALAGSRAGHGPAWKVIAVRLGAVPRACTTGSDVVVTPGDWQATCPGCAHVYHKYKRPKSLGGYRCRCPARSPLVFAFMGDPARAPVVPMTAQESANWEATCAGCSTVHLRVRRPRPGIWRCKCPHRGELIWRFRAR